MLRDGFAILTSISLGLTLWRWALHLRFPLHEKPSARAEGDDARLPGLTILKPLKGCDDETRECLRSWCQQNYPGPLQILFGVAEVDDPAAPIVRALLAEYPDLDARLVICPEPLGANRKVSTLRQLEPFIRHPLLIISDADTRAARDFAARVAARCTPGVGLVNSFYRLANPGNAAMRWEAMAINADFWTHVLQAASVQKIDFALGAAMTLPAASLKEIGGFTALGDFLADDYQLGNRIAARGQKIALATEVVECWEPTLGWAGVWRHQVRWARTVRACQPAPFFASIVNNSSVWPLLLLATSLHGPTWAWALAVAALGIRMATALHQLARMTRNNSAARDWWIVPLKDILDVLVWVAAFGGSHVEWRGERYRVEAGGKLERV